MADVLLDTYKAAAPTLWQTLIGPLMPAIKEQAEEAGKAAYEALLPKLEEQAEKTAQQTLILLAVAIGTGLALWMVFRKKKRSRK